MGKVWAVLFVHLRRGELMKIREKDRKKVPIWEKYKLTVVGNFQNNIIMMIADNKRKWYSFYMQWLLRILLFGVVT